MRVMLYAKKDQFVGVGKARKRLVFVDYEKSDDGVNMHAVRKVYEQRKKNGFEEIFIALESGLTESAEVEIPHG